jgi:hypothetical protein
MTGCLYRLCGPASCPLSTQCHGFQANIFYLPHSPQLGRRIVPARGTPASRRAPAPLKSRDALPIYRTRSSVGMYHNLAGYLDVNVDLIVKMACRCAYHPFLLDRKMLTELLDWRVDLRDGVGGRLYLRDGAYSICFVNIPRLT